MAALGDARGGWIASLNARMVGMTGSEAPVDGSPKRQVRLLLLDQTGVQYLAIGNALLRQRPPRGGFARLLDDVGKIRIPLVLPVPNKGTWPLPFRVPPRVSRYRATGISLASPQRGECRIGVTRCACGHSSSPWRWQYLSLPLKADRLRRSVGAVGAGAPAATATPHLVATAITATRLAPTATHQAPTAEPITADVWIGAVMATVGLASAAWVATGTEGLAFAARVSVA